MNKKHRDILGIIALVLMGVAWVNEFSFMGLVMMLAGAALVGIIWLNETK